MNSGQNIYKPYYPRRDLYKQANIQSCTYYTEITIDYYYNSLKRFSLYMVIFF